MVVGGEQANNEELKKKRFKKKKHAEERKKLLAESLRNGDDEEFMLSVYDSVQEEVKYKTKMLDKEKEQVKFLKNEVSDLQREFEKEREEYLDTIRKQERQLKLLFKITQKLQPIIPHDSSYYNLDKIQAAAIWNEELQDWILPELKRERLALPTMGYELNNNHGNPINGDDSLLSQSDFNNNDINETNFNSNYHNPVHNPVLLNVRRQTELSNHNQIPMSTAYMSNMREPEIDRYRLKLESSQFNGSNYFKTKRQSELLGQTQELKTNGRLSPLSSGNAKLNRRPYP